MTDTSKLDLDELERVAKKASKSLGLGGWYVFPEDGFTFQITTASGPNRGLHIAQDMREDDARFVATLVNSYRALIRRLRAAEECAELFQHEEAAMDGEPKRIVEAWQRAKNSL